MKLQILLLACATFASASDLPCTRTGGTCLNYVNYICTAGYEQGLCDGDSNRRCCAECDATCQATEAAYYDGACTNSGGKCMHDSNYCSGHYETGLCGGPAERKCCLTASGLGCYGNINNVDTTGASCTTSSQDGLAYCGVQASRTMAQTDFGRMSQYKDEIEQAAASRCMDASVIAGIISRETRAGAALSSSGYGADGHGYGLMQVDDRYHTIKGGPYSLEHIEQGTDILIGMIEAVADDHRTWTQDMQYKGGISAYNAGPGNVVNYDTMDVGTTGNDYSNDVVARSQYYKENGY